MSEEQIVSCPYNVNHRFARSKLMFHLTRCKDRLKVQHLYMRCRYSSLHIIHKDQIESHELVCPEREMHEALKQDMQVADNIIRKQKEEYSEHNSRIRRSRSRSRSRSRNRSRSRSRDALRNNKARRSHSSDSSDSPVNKRQFPNGKHEHSSESDAEDRLTLLEQCFQCKRILREYRAQHPNSDDQITQLYNQYNELCKL